MFGIFKRIKDLEKRVAKLEQKNECAKGYHENAWVFGHDSGIARHDNWVEGLKCKHCGKLEEYQKVEKKS